MKKTTRWSCKRVCDVLSDYVHQRLSDGDGLAITQHVQGCIACQGALRLEQRLVGVSKEAITVPADFASLVLAAHKQQQANDVLNRIFASYRMACIDFARSILVDPFLLVHYRLRHVFGSVWWDVYASLSVVTRRLLTEMVGIGQHIVISIKHAIRRPTFGNG